MARKKATIPTNSVSEAVQLLRQGKKAPAWACRELLDLGMSNAPADVVRAVHTAIHDWQRGESSLDSPCVRVAAAFWLLLDLGKGQLPKLA